MPDRLPDNQYEGRKFAGVTTPMPIGNGGENPTKNDVKLVGQALKSRWPMSEEKRVNIIKWLMDVAENAHDERARVNAAKVLVEADKLNMEDEKRAAGGEKLSIDITSGGKPLGAGDVRQLTDDELQQRIIELETRAITSGQ